MKKPSIAVSFALLISASIVQSQVVPAITNPQPRIFLNASEIATIRARVSSGIQPHASAYAFLKSDTIANIPSSTRLTPYLGNDGRSFYNVATLHGGFARDLAIAYQVSKGIETPAQTTAYARKAANILRNWASGSPLPGTALDPGSPAIANHGMWLSRRDHSLRLRLRSDWRLHRRRCPFDRRPAGHRNVVERLGSPNSVRPSPTGTPTSDYNFQNYNNHLAADIAALVAIGYAVGDRSQVQWAISVSIATNPRDWVALLKGLILRPGDPTHHREKAGAPLVQDGEIYDRYRHYTGPLKGLQYSTLALTLLSVPAEICHRNGLDLWNYSASTGETLRLAWSYYADFYRLQSATIKLRLLRGGWKRELLRGERRKLADRDCRRRRRRVRARPHSTPILGGTQLVDSRSPIAVKSRAPRADIPPPRPRCPDPRDAVRLLQGIARVH